MTKKLRTEPFFARIDVLDTIQQAEHRPSPRFRFLNGSWPVRDGNTYPRFDTTRRQGPLGGYESYVRRSPPATE